MFERFSSRARMMVVHAQEEARALRHGYIGTEHLLLALVREADGPAGQALGDLGIRLSAARNEVITRHPPEPDRSPGGPSAAQLTGAEIEFLRAEVERLRALLRRHGIDPGEDLGTEPGPESAS